MALSDLLILIPLGIVVCAGVVFYCAWDIGKSTKRMRRARRPDGP